MGRSPTNSKQKLIDTAIQLIWRNSYGSVSVDDICKTAEVKKGSFYHYFKSKSDLAIVSVEFYFEQSQDKYSEAFSARHTPKQRFENLVDLIIATQEETTEKYGQVCGCPLATIGSEMAGQDESIRDAIDKLMQKHKRRYYEIAISDMIELGQLAKATDVEGVAAEIYCYILGQLMSARINNSLDSLKRDLKPGLLRILNLQEN